MTYDQAGNAVESKVTNSAVSGAVSDTTVAYSELGQPTSKTEQAGTSAAQTTTYTYDKDGQQASQTDPSGTSHVDRDSLGRVVTAWHPDGSQDSATYDKAGHTLTSSDGTKTTTYVYDPLWRISSEQVKDVATGTVEQTTSYAYDANGNQLTPITTYADGTESGVTYTYDKLGRIKTMSDGTRSFIYDANSNLTTMKVLHGSAAAVEEDFSYDGGNRPVGLTDKVGPSGTVLHTYSFSYDGRGNASQVVSDTSTTSYSYDNANQLLSATTGTAVTSYAYDANHNRTSLTTSAGTTTYGYDSSSDTELTSMKDPNGKVTTYAYDASGNLSTATFDASGANQQTTYHYNTKNLLSEIDNPDGSKISFTYDADGNRLTKTVVSGGPVPTQTMIKDVYQAGRIAYETDGAGTTLATFSYDPNGDPESVVVGSDPNTGPRYYYVYNTHGDVVALVDGSGNIAAWYSYDAFGAITDSSESFANGWSNPYRYDGMDRVRYDSETGLYWMSVRAYDPTIGRFISRDPQGRTPLIFATQPYAYAGNNPLRNVDPSGQRYFDPGDPDRQAPPFGAPHRSSWMQPTAGSDPVDSGPTGCQRGAASQCLAWVNAKSAYDSGLQTSENLKYGLIALVDFGFDLWDLVMKDRGDLISDLIDVLALIGDGLVGANYFLAAYQSAGHDVGGLRHTLDVIGKFANWASGPLQAVRKGMSFLVRAALGLGWQGFKKAFQLSDPIGVILLIVRVVVSKFAADAGDNIRSIVLHYIQGSILDDESNIALEESQSTDQFCAAHLSWCPGY